ncbi:Elongator complex protein [Podila epigama]|nr:Elongator complex protein [Podila epigama]
MAPILERILTGKEPSPFILVKDTLEQSGHLLALELLNNSPKDHNIVLICTETDPTCLVPLVKGNFSISVVDAYANPLGWTSEFEPSLSSIQVSTKEKNVVVTSVDSISLRDVKRASKVLTNILTKQKNNVTIYFESISPFLAASVSDTFNLIRSVTTFLTDTSRIIAVHHEDVPDADAFQPDPSKPFASNSLAHIATTLIAIKSSQMIKDEQEDLRRGVVSQREFAYLTVHGNAWDSAVCDIEHKRKSGKVAREVFKLFSMTNAYHLGSPTGDIVVVNVWDVVGDMPDVEKLDLEESQPDPAANLSFNLNLTEEQRQAKNHTVLPYLKTQESSGAIYYEPDAADDFDDDDPDDDLTI